jgi:hypothetical protein
MTVSGKEDGNNENEGTKNGNTNILVASLFPEKKKIKYDPLGERELTVQLAPQS